MRDASPHFGRRYLTNRCPIGVPRPTFAFSSTRDIHRRRGYYFPGIVIMSCSRRADRYGPYLPVSYVLYLSTVHGCVVA